MSNIVLLICLRFLHPYLHDFQSCLVNVTKVYQIQCDAGTAIFDIPRKLIGSLLIGKAEDKYLKIYITIERFYLVAMVNAFSRIDWPL